MSKAKNLIKNWRVILLLIAVVLSLIAISPRFNVEGVSIRTVAKNSSASDAGMLSPSPKLTPVNRERILSLNNIQINSVEEFYELESTLLVNTSIQIKTNQRLYRLLTKKNTQIVELNETETITFIEEEFDEEANKTINVSKQVTKKKTREEVVPGVNLGITVFEAPSTNVRKGLDLQGGTRVLLQPERKLDESEMDGLTSNMKERLNVYGLSDVIVRESSDLSGNQYVVVEVAGVNEEEVKQLISNQGKFEARIAGEVVFIGGRDIVHVCRTAECSGIDPQRGCGPSGNGGWTCSFRFSISLTPAAAKRQAAATSKLDVISDDGGKYLSESIELFLDDQKVDQLRIGADLKGQEATEISISGGGAGLSRQDATSDALKNMKSLQTILITGSLPVKINVVKTDSISSVLGAEFIKNSLFIGVLAILAVVVVVFIRYRKLEVSLPMLLSLFSEVIIIMGIAAVINWNIDLAAIAGIIIAVGTGVDHQIVITDEVLLGKKEETGDWKKNIKKAFFIIMAAYFTTVVAMVPLLFAGAGLLKGFALTTIIGVSIGVFITRPAYAASIKELLR